MTEIRNGSVTLDLSRRETWVLHAAVLAAVDREIEADRTPSRRIELLDRVEGGVELDERDLELAEQAVEAYLEDAPARDRKPGRTVLDRVRAARA